MSDQAPNALYLPRHCLVTLSARQDPKLHNSARIYLGELEVLANKFGYVFASDTELAAMKGVDTRTIERWHTLLEKRGHIRRETTRHPYLAPGKAKPEVRTKRKIFIEDDSRKRVNSGNSNNFTDPTRMSVHNVTCSDPTRMSGISHELLNQESFDPQTPKGGSIDSFESKDSYHEPDRPPAKGPSTPSPKPSLPSPQGPSTPGPTEPETNPSKEALPETSARAAPPNPNQSAPVNGPRNDFKAPLSAKHGSSNTKVAPNTENAAEAKYEGFVKNRPSPDAHPAFCHLQGLVGIDSAQNLWMQAARRGYDLEPVIRVCMDPNFTPKKTYAHVIQDAISNNKNYTQRTITQTKQTKSSGSKTDWFSIFKEQDRRN